MVRSRSTKSWKPLLHKRFVISQFVYPLEKDYPQARKSLPPLVFQAIRFCTDSREGAGAFTPVGAALARVPWPV